jgi:predicted nuclease with TOPRIM domain
MSDAQKQHSERQEESNHDLIKRVRYELSLPVQSQFIREDVRRLANRLDSLEEQLEALREAVKWALHTDVWIDDNPFHGRTLDTNGTTKTQVWDNLQAAYDAASSPASSPDVEDAAWEKRSRER